MASSTSFSNLKNFKFLFKNGLILRNKSVSSHSWIQRRLKDPYVEKAKKENYRCRSAFKLIEIDDKFKIIKAGQTVIDLGAAPGSWTQVLVKRTNSDGNSPKSKIGNVVSIDLSPMHPIHGAKLLSGMDFTLKSSQQNILEALNGVKPDNIFSDMSPAATGVKYLDQERSLSLAVTALVFSLEHLKPKGGLLIKMWEGQHLIIANQMKKFFNSMNFVKPDASQDESAEIYLLGRDFKGVVKEENKELKKEDEL